MTPWCVFQQGKIGPKGGPGGAGPKGEPVRADLNNYTCLIYITCQIHEDNVWCLLQGIPGRDGKDGTPGLDGEKVCSTFSFSLNEDEIKLEVDHLHKADVMVLSVSIGWCWTLWGRRRERTKRPSCKYFEIDLGVSCLEDSTRYYLNLLLLWLVSLRSSLIVIATLISIHFLKSKGKLQSQWIKSPKHASCLEHNKKIACGVCGETLIEVIVVYFLC